MKQSYENSISENTALVYGLITFTLWGLMPLYWYMLREVTAVTIFAHRIIWSAAFLFLVLIVTQRLPEVWAGVKNKKVLLILAATTLLISSNWLTYIWAVNNGHVIETSIGYYINPLVNVMLGWIFLGETLRKYQKLAVIFAAIGVAYMSFNYGEIPYIALILAFSFAFYSLLRKLVEIGSQPALMIETSFVMLPALIYLLFIADTPFFHQEISINLLFIGCGIVTALPLVMVAMALKKLPLSVVGFMQYISPTLQLIIGVFVLNEDFSFTRLITFVFIWIALIIFSFEGLHNRNSIKRKKTPPTVS